MSVRRGGIRSTAIAILVTLSQAMKFPNEIEEAPLVLCEPTRIVVKIKTTSSNPSHMYAEDFFDDPDCSQRNKNVIEFRHGRCGMSTERTDEPKGAVQRICLSVQLHPLFVTEADRSYCVQCVYVEQHILSDFEQSISISETSATEMEPQFDFNTVPRCSYSIRKGSSTGPPAHYAAIGESVFHVWQCEGASLGILVQNCYVEDGQGNRILIIDQNGCGVDHYVMATPEYNDELSVAYQETHVFKFAQRTVTRFACQIRICMHGEDCDAISPPKSCPSLEQRLAEAHRLSDEPSASYLRPIYQSADALSAAQPDVTDQLPANATIGSVFFGSRAYSVRARRDSLSPKPSTIKRSRRGYPEMDVVGEIRVLENSDDVRFFEHQLSSLDEQCVSGLTYTLLLTSLVVFALLLLTILLLLLGRKNKPPHIPNHVLHYNERR